LLGFLSFSLAFGYAVLSRARLVGWPG